MSDASAIAKVQPQVEAQDRINALESELATIRQDQIALRRETTLAIQELLDAQSQNDLDAFDIRKYILSGRNIQFDRVGNAFRINGYAYPWSKVLFGYSIAANVLSMKAGEIHYKDTIYTFAAADLTISANNTYVYCELEWGTGTCSYKQTVTKNDTIASSSHYRKWLYLVTYVSTPNTIFISSYGHTGGAIDLMPVK